MSKGRPPVSLIPLGGTGAIGKNMIVVEQDDAILVIDAGLMFPDESLLGVDIVIPDMTYLVENAERVLGVILTHGHEDHTGALPFLLERVRVPVWGTPLTLGLVETKLAEYGLDGAVEMRPMESGSEFDVGPFHVSAVAVNHSVPDGVGLGIETAQGLIVHSGDFKFDQTPLTGPAADIHRLAEFGMQGALALISDCTNINRLGHTPSERLLAKEFHRLFSEARGRVIVATFASNVSRIQQIVDVSRRHRRKVAVLGRSMVRVSETAERLGYLKIPEGLRVGVREIEALKPREVTVLTTGTQGEPLSALSLMAQGEHKHIEVEPGDTVIISASPIPGNEALIFRTINNLFRQGAHVVHGPEMGVHVSGHGNREDIKLLLSLVKPKYVIPYHGEYRHLVSYRVLAAELGMADNQVFLLDLGDVLRFENGTAQVVAEVPSGSVNVDGLGVGDVGDVVLRDRHLLAENGILFAVLVVDHERMELLAPPEIYSRGFVYVQEASDLIEGARQAAAEAFAQACEAGESDPEALSLAVRSALRRWVFARTERRPVVLPAVIYLGTRGGPIVSGEGRAD